MSLFPAYSNENNSVDSSSAELENKNWLTNNSYEIPEELNKSNDEDSSHRSLSPERVSPRAKKKKAHKHRTKQKKNTEDRIIKAAHTRMVEILSDNKSFYEDRIGSKNNILIPTLMKDDAPLYHKTRKVIKSYSVENKKNIKWRYFKCSSKMFQDEKVVSHLPPQTNENILPILNSESVGRNTEQHITETTASYNQRLNEDPHDEELWLDFVKFQDEVQLKENHRREAKENSVLPEERKLSILSKALQHNPLSEMLLFCKFNILNKLHNLDKLSDEVYTALRQDFGNVELWIRYIRITQCTVARCSVPDVISLYTKALEKVNFMQKYGILVTEMHLLGLFLSCGLFLRQCGLWEQVCMLIRINLQLNMSSSESENYKVDVILPDDKIKELEDEILSCGLPINALWLRLEKLRQRVHWYPVSDADCDDPQRVVLPTDVTDLVRPITNSSLTLRIIIITMYLLKVPLLPLRDTVFRSLSLHKIPWHMDSCEVLLSAFCSLGITQGQSVALKESVLSCMKDLVSYPQFVNDDLGQTEYLEFIRSTFRKISRNLPLKVETIVLVWWLRFERSLLIAGNQPVNRKKRLKSFVKDLLKEERHRNNLSLFIEYALLERELNGNDVACTKILETALQMQPLKKITFSFSANKNDLTYLYRILVEIFLASGNNEKGIRLLLSLALYIPENDVTINDSNINAALSEYQKVVDEMMSEDFMFEEFELNHIEPQFFVEWVHCQVWLLYLTESVKSASNFLDDLLKRLSCRDENKPTTIDVYYRELLVEVKVNVWYFYCNSNKTAFNVLNEVVSQSISEYPNNMCFLGTLFDLETKLSFVSPWWKTVKCLESNDSQIARLILILVCRRRLMAYETASLSSLKLLNLDGPVSAPCGLNYRMKTLLQKLTSDEVTSQCPLIWIIYLQYCAKYEIEAKYKDVFYLALENCPWVKTLYMEAAHVLSDQVSQIQDLMLEKEMRIHITQDEIDILRNS